MLGDYGTYQKFLPYDSSARVPLIVRYPEVFKGGEVDRRFVDLNDILPTVLDAAGVAYPNPAILPGSLRRKSPALRIGRSSMWSMRMAPVAGQVSYGI